MFIVSGKFKTPVSLALAILVWLGGFAGLCVAAPAVATIDPVGTVCPHCKPARCGMCPLCATAPVSCRSCRCELPQPRTVRDLTTPRDVAHGDTLGSPVFRTLPVISLHQPLCRPTLVPSTTLFDLHCMLLN